MSISSSKPLASTCVAVAIGIAICACHDAGRARQPRDQRVSAVLVRESFDQPATVRSEWLATLPETAASNLIFVSGVARFVLLGQGEMRLSRPVETHRAADRARNRLRISARLRSESTDVAPRMSMLLDHPTLGDREQIFQSPIQPGIWSLITAIVDVDPLSMRVELALAARGKGSAWFDDVRVEVLGPGPAVEATDLSAWQMESLQALTRAATFIRYRHPSDQSARLDWNLFLPFAIDRILRVRTRDALLEELRELFASIAPTVEFSASRAFLHSTFGSVSELADMQGSC